MNYYELNPDMIVRFEFFGGLLHCITNADEYELDFANTIFLKCINEGFSESDTFKIINEIIKCDYVIDISDYLNEKIISLNNKRKKRKDTEKFKKIIEEEIKNVKNINHLSFPIQVSLYLNSTCQLNCKFCFFEDKMDVYKEFHCADDWISLIKSLKKYGLIYLSILGGEPTLYNEIDKILLAIDELKIKTTITTNAFHIKDSTMKIIINSNYITPTISLQSLNDDTNRYLMGVNPENALQTVNEFVKNGKIPRINTVVTNQSKKELCDMVDFCVEKGITDFYIDVFVNNGNDGLKNHTFSEYRKIKEYIDEYIKNKNYEDRIFFQLQGCLLYSAYKDCNEENLETEYEKIKYGCEAGNTKLEIMPNGDVYPCVMFNHNQFKYENVFKRDIKDIWYNSDYINKLRNRKCLYDKCLGCKFYDFCNGGCPALVLNNNDDINLMADERCQIIMEEKNE